MDSLPDFTHSKTLLLAWLGTQPRVLALFMVVPLFSPQLMPGLIRYALGAALGLLAVPPLAGALATTELQAPAVLALVFKEAFVGLVLGYVLAIPFWAFEAIGFFIDNQRGASISATLNPQTGNDSSPLGILFNQAFIVLFFALGGMSVLLDVLYQSFRVWPVLGWAPQWADDAVPLYLEFFTRIVRGALLLSAPVIVAMFLAEFGLALISRFVPQLDVFFLAMPIKSALAVLVLLVYLATLVELAGEELDSVHQMIAALAAHWSATGSPP